MLLNLSTVLRFFSFFSVILASFLASDEVLLLVMDVVGGVAFTEGEACDPGELEAAIAAAFLAC